MNEYLKFEELILINLRKEYTELEFQKFFVDKMEGSYHSISVSKKSQDTLQVGMQINLDCLYSDFNRKQVGIDEILKQIRSQLDSFEKNSSEIRGKLENIMNFDKIKNGIMPRVVNKEKALKGKDIVIDITEDLACLYYIDFDSNAINITDNMLSLWRISRDTLKRVALQNLKEKYTVAIIPINELISEMLDDESIELGVETPLYVVLLKNDYEIYQYSAVIMVLAPEIFKIPSGDDYYIIPSSEHEIILIPENIASRDEVRNMVEEVNSCAVSESDFLSNNIYQYDEDSKKIIII